MKKETLTGTPIMLLYTVLGKMLRQFISLAKDQGIFLAQQYDKKPKKQIECPVCSKDTTIIPSGAYCYSVKKFDSGKVITNNCPFWSFNKDQPEQENGYCRFLNKGDWEYSHVSLLWDQVKECGINIDENPDD